ncbi:adenosylcobinamide-GDP ribazoletransferase [Pseudalkalibacillus salsuginis]|uniref:adenosylcobinamide-GDP ribazoletransferase n=1 Tax=Pseudalkalibacillus salsuginis TaxID=2910972 RepID=UPI001F1CCB13|nr:adenosylcobinamide-GDP ribazoletransferase [Pseudalkalibacillus salsuginis]MCF6411678.1 adenosylcobinamide-GDP ribazoletransferase [Pseudalkalibacillus salsuginis]
MKYIKGFIINLQFFTMIPIPLEVPMDDDHLEKAVRTFPLLGLFQGLTYAFLVYILVHWTPFSSLAIAFFLWIMMIILTGGIHLDGWMDASDAYFSYCSIERRLEIMKDPRIGAFGVLSVIILLSTKFLFIYEIVTTLTLTSYFAIVFMPFLSRGLMGILLVLVKPAKEEGLAHHFGSTVDSSLFGIYCVYILLVSGAFMFMDKKALPAFMIMLIVTAICFVFIRSKVGRWFGGITGDVLGASVEGVELMLWMTIWLLHYSVML